MAKTLAHDLVVVQQPFDDRRFSGLVCANCIGALQVACSGFLGGKGTTLESSVCYRPQVNGTHRANLSAHPYDVIAYARNYFRIIAVTRK